MSLNELFANERKRLGMDAPPSAPASPARLALVANGDPRADRWLQVKVDNQIAELAAMGPDSGRNATLNAIAFSLGRFAPRWLDEADISDRLMVACHTNGLVAEDGPRQCEQTIRSGLNKGMLDPRDPPISEQDSLASLVSGPVATLPPPQGSAPSAAITFDPVTGEVTEPATPTDEEMAERAHAARVHYELVQLRARHDAKLEHAAELAARTFRAPAYTQTLADELLIPDEPVQYAVEELLPVGGNALLAAQFKAGKTTLVTNLLRAYADNELFLGRFKVTPGSGRIAIFNYELSPSQYRTWLRDAQIVNTDRVTVLHLRGYRLPLTVPSVEDWVVGWLKDHDCTAWIADPFARAATGTDENSNTEVGVWLDTFDVIKERAGISEAVLPTHTGRAVQEQGQERARGATRLDDWADVRWLLTKDEEDNRYFRATGRDVELGEELLSYEPTSRSLTLGGGDRRWVANRAMSQRVLDFVNANPGAGVRAIQGGVKGNKDEVDRARLDLIRRHKVRVEDGPRSAQNHFANEVEA